MTFPQPSSTVPSSVLAASWIGGWLLVGGLALWGMAPHLTAISTSFPGYWLVAREVLSGTPAVLLYDDAYLQPRLAAAGFPGDRMFGPPTLALTLVPLCGLPYPAARTVWMLGVLLPSLLGSLYLLFGRHGVWGLALAAAFVLGRPVAANMEVAQTYPVMLALHGVALRGWQAGRSGVAVSALGLGPLIVLRGWHGLPQAAAWLAAGQPRGFLAAGAVVAAIVVGTLPLLGVASWRHFLAVQLPQAGGEGAMVLAYQTWRSLALHIGTFHPILSPDPPLPGFGVPLWLGGAALIGGLSLWATRCRGQGPGAPEGFATWTAVALLLAPVAEDHHMILAALPASVLWPHRPGWVLAALALILPPWPFDQPALLGGWRSLLAYPRVYGMALLWLGCVTLDRRAAYSPPLPSTPSGERAETGDPR